MTRDLVPIAIVGPTVRIAVAVPMAPSVPLERLPGPSGDDPFHRLAAAGCSATAGTPGPSTAAWPAGASS